MKFRRFYRQKCWSSMLEPPEELEDKSGDCEDDKAEDMEEEYYRESEPYHYAELRELRGIRDVEFQNGQNL